MPKKTVAVLAVAILAGTIRVNFSPGDNPVCAADKEKKGYFLPSGDVLGFTGKGQQPFPLERTYPGINGALLLTLEQMKQILEARQETIATDAVSVATRTVKGDPNATDAQKEAARKVIDEAREKYAQKVSAILTADQKALVAKINTASEEVQKAALEALQRQFAAAKGNADQMAEVQRQLQEKLATDMAAKLAGILTAEQNIGYTKAALDQKIAEEQAKNTKKPTK